ncbi:MAG: peptide deformylase, partial [Gammaproteobacteria bacterium]|nr:peptide deformylase [Gammaproteobacteria bacterium]
MTIEPLITIPDPVLREVSKPVERIDDEMRTLLNDMLETMYDAPGIGLAAIQLGIPLRIVTVDVAQRRINDEKMQDDEVEGEGDNGEPAEDEEEITPELNPIFLINPEIVSQSDERSIYEEGCLSIPEFYADVERPAFCRIKYLDRDGKQQTLDADNILATCIQHEIDHLEGTLFIDHISKLKRDMVVKKFTKIAKQSARNNRM